MLDVENLSDLLEVLGVGFHNDGNSNKDCEVASLYILSQYIELVQKERLKTFWRC